MIPDLPELVYLALVAGVIGWLALCWWPNWRNL